MRIEDIDAGRCREPFVERNLADLRWLGLDWDERPVRQSRRMPLYSAALEQLRALGVVYPCFCTRSAIRAEIAAAGGAPHIAGGGIYPGTCRGLDAGRRAALLAEGRSWALQLDADRALRLTGALDWFDQQRGRQQVTAARIGDVIIARKEMPASYHLCVVVDDAAQEVSLVTRGEDLLASTPVHRTLQALLGLPVPEWWHHPLCRDASGRRLAKRDGDASLRTLRERGFSPADVLRMMPKLEEAGEPATMEALR